MAAILDSRGHRVQSGPLEVKGADFVSILERVSSLCSQRLPNGAIFRPIGYKPDIMKSGKIFLFYMVDGKWCHSVTVWSTVRWLFGEYSQNRPVWPAMGHFALGDPWNPRWPPFLLHKIVAAILDFRGQRVQSDQVQVKATSFGSILRKFLHWAPNSNRMAPFSVQLVKHGR